MSVWNKQQQALIYISIIKDNLFPSVQELRVLALLKKKKTGWHHRDFTTAEPLSWGWGVRYRGYEIQLETWYGCVCVMVRSKIMKHFELPIEVDLKAMAGVKGRTRPSLKEVVVATKIAINNNCSIYGVIPMCLYYNV